MKSKIETNVSALEKAAEAAEERFGGVGIVNLHERSKVSYDFAEVEKELGFHKAHLDALNSNTELVWEHKGLPNNDVQVMRAAIEKRTNGEFYYSAVDTISPECHVWTFGFFTVEENRLVMLKDSGDEASIKDGWERFCEIIRKIHLNPLVVDDFTFIAVLMTDQEETDDGDDDLPF